LQVETLDFTDCLRQFGADLPYKGSPYSKKNWGHPLHSLCSYPGKLKPSIAYWLVKVFTKPGQRVLDPTGGTGTIAFEACLQGRIGITNDLSPFAATVGAAKVKLPGRTQVTKYLEDLSEGLMGVTLTGPDWEDANFGLNASIKEYFHPTTLEEVLKARKFFLQHHSWNDVTQLYVLANLLHILHGNRPYALSRNSHSITPFNPSGEFEYRPLMGKLRERIDRIVDTPLPNEYLPGQYYATNFTDLPGVVSNVDAIITSPPFVGMRFDRPNWMRLWFCGWNADDFHTKSLNFLERRQTKSWDVYFEYFQACSDVLKRDGLVILHVGGSPKYDMLTELIIRARKMFEVVDIITEDVSHNETHGIKDQGTTRSHQFLFLKKK